MKIYKEKGEGKRVPTEVYASPYHLVTAVSPKMKAAIVSGPVDRERIEKSALGPRPGVAESQSARWLKHAIRINLPCPGLNTDEGHG